MGAIFSAHSFGRKEPFLLSLCQCPPSRLRVTRLSREGQAVSGGRHREPSILGTARPEWSPLGEAKKQSLPQVSAEKVKGIGRVPWSVSTCPLNQQQMTAVASLITNYHHTHFGEGKLGARFRTFLISSMSHWYEDIPPNVVQIQVWELVIVINFNRPLCRDRIPNPVPLWLLWPFDIDIRLPYEDFFIF